MERFQMLSFLILLLTTASHSTMVCELKKYQSRYDYKISDNAAAGIAYDNGTTQTSMQVFQCTCLTQNEIFDDQDVTNFDKYFYKAGVMDWVQSQVLRIYNCSALNLDLKTGKNTISQLLNRKLLIVEDVAQLVLTSFTAGAPYNADETFSSIYFRNVTFYQLPPFIDFADRVEILFSNVKTNEGSSKVEPVELRVKNSNYTRNPVLRIEYSRFGGINILTDGYNRNTFVVNVQNNQNFNDTGCYKDYKGSVQIVGNSFGYLRDKNINVTGANDVMIEDNFVDTSYGNPVFVVNSKQTKVRNNIFGFQLMEPLIYLSYFRIVGSVSRVCSNYDLPETSVILTDLSGNQVRKLTPTSLVKLDIDPSYSINFVDKIAIQDIRLSVPCNCTEKNTTGVIMTDSDKLGLRAIRDSQCIPMRPGQPLMPPQMVRRAGVCTGQPISSQPYSLSADQAPQTSWLANNPYYQKSSAHTSSSFTFMTQFIATSCLILHNY